MRVVLSLFPPSVAVMVVVPSAKLVARPVLVPMVATLVSELVQVTRLVKLAVDKSEYVPVAVNCWVLPEGTVGLSGVTAMVSKTAVVRLQE